MELSDRTQPPLQQTCEDRFELHPKLFQYKPLDPGSIRVFKLLPGSTSENLRFTLHHKPLRDPEHDLDDDGLRWTALSYCWSDPKPVGNIVINDSPFAVAQNLLAWLRTIPDSFMSEIYICADAICINQADIPERNTQVQRMWRIYAHGWYVVSWLGLPDEPITTVIEACKAIEQITGCANNMDFHVYSASRESADVKHQTAERLASIPGHQQARTAFWKLQYWSRLWIAP